MKVAIMQPYFLPYIGYFQLISAVDLFVVYDNIKYTKKGWINPKNYRNESWDLLAYCLATTLTPMIALDHMNMADPPSWAAEWDHNDLVFNPAEKAKPFEAVKSDDGLTQLAKLAESLA